MVSLSICQPLALAALLAAACLSSAPATDAQDKDPVVFREEGEASWYGPGFHGRRTANGERFDQNQLTAAHPSLPLGSEITVKNPETGKQVEVEVNDRGPYAKGRDLDLSKAAAEELGITKQGVAEVEIEATESQVEQAIDTPKEVSKVEQELKKARKEAAQEGMPQPGPVPDLEPAVAASR
jgi:rare lipoprotein A (peptidoglycan hydrolase)